MYRKILIPTDGSELCRTAAVKGIELARGLGAQVVAFHAIPATSYMLYTESGPSDLMVEQFEKEARARGERLTKEVADLAAAQGVPCETLCLVNDHPWEGIIEAANTRGCDLIFMASHGRRGLSALLLGSETMKVLTHTKVPVLVYR
ncbi:MAG TPA: universal stress protein [Burkholderiales bacterium]|jgi:nucleotide-binding universal stress UspA family protein|nr:universal stress protein [Burkholderiales bacterium]